jgi:hypothetical protein
MFGLPVNFPRQFFLMIFLLGTLVLVPLPVKGVSVLDFTGEYHEADLRVQDFSNSADNRLLLVDWSTKRFFGTAGDTFNTTYARERYTSENQFLSPSFVSGNIYAFSDTYVLSDNPRFSLENVHPNVALSRNGQIYVGTESGTSNGHTINSLFAGTQSTRMVSNSDLSGTYQIKLLNLEDFNGLVSDTLAEIRTGYLSFDGSGSSTLEIETYTSRDTTRSGTATGSYQAVDGETYLLQVPGAPDYRFSSTSNSSILTGMAGDSTTGHPQQSLFMAVERDTGFTKNDLAGTYQIRGLQFYDFQQNRGEGEAVSIRGELIFDGEGSYTARYDTVSSRNRVETVEFSDSYSVNTDGSFALQTPDQPNIDLVLSPDTGGFVASIGNVNLNRGVTQQALILGVFSASGQAGETDPEGGCLIERAGAPAWLTSGLRSFRDWSLDSPLGRGMTALYYD